MTAMAWTTAVRAAAAAVFVTAAAGAAHADSHFNYHRFASPSGNIACAITDDGSGVRCDIVHHSFTPPPQPAGGCGAAGYGHTVAMTASTPAQFTCAGDTVARPGEPILAYGSTAIVGGTTCSSDQDAVTCTDGEHRIRLSRVSYDLR
ncbi:MAG: hypothetical protein J2P18_12990 [Nocardia sp.]|nr:hypothetical protein [Nocardia sp.]